jgi:predicted kinase
VNSITPSPPDWRIEWPAVEAACPWLEELRGCPQDPAYHEEGDVAVHTRLVADAMVALPAWRALPEGEREVLFLAALAHDLGKPLTTVTGSDGHISSPGHSLKGSMRARALLYRSGIDPVLRERVAALARFHQMPFHLLDRGDPKKAAYRASLCTRCGHLALLAEADVRGRTAADPSRLLEDVALFLDFCREEGCADGPRAFPSDHSRFWYFRTPGRSPDYLAHDGTRCVATVMCGLPAAGKDAWIMAHSQGEAVVSLDDVRASLDVDPSDAQGPVIERARELAREHLRARRSFFLNATNVSRDIRSRWVSLFAEYHARIRIVHVEVPIAVLHERNNRREARVPPAVIERLIDRWEPPDLTEAHEVIWAAQAADLG